jgi:threonine dehydratase
MPNKFSIRTPLIPFYGHSNKNIFLKLENLQPFGSYKIRGVENIIKNLSKIELQNGLVAASAGNMGQAVAYLAKKYNIPCTILVPDSAPSIKIKTIRSLGANIIKLPYENVWKIVQDGKYPKNPGYFIHPSNNTLLTEGYASIAKEILVDLPDLDAIVIPFGVGGLTLGVASYIRKHNSNIKIYTVEPETSHPLHRLLIRKDSSFISVRKSIVDAIGTPEVIPSIRDIIRSLVDVPTVSTVDQVKSAISTLFNKHHIIAEGAGAASFAAALTDQVSGENIACIISGGNIDFDKFTELYNELDTN